MNENKKLKAGEKYLTVHILGNIKLSAFPNTEGRKLNPKAPHFKGEGIAVWVNEKRVEEPDPVEELI